MMSLSTVSSPTLSRSIRPCLIATRPMARAPMASAPTAVAPMANPHAAAPHVATPTTEAPVFNFCRLLIRSILCRATVHLDHQLASIRPGGTLRTIVAVPSIPMTLGWHQNCEAGRPGGSNLRTAGLSQHKRFHVDRFDEEEFRAIERRVAPY